MIDRTGLLSQRAVRGYTLIELLLAVSLTLLLASALIFSFSSLLRSAQLEEGVGRLESLIRFARAQAAYSGRKVQLVFGQELAGSTATVGRNIRLNWEPDPLDQPGHFEEITDVAWQVQGIDDLLEVKDVQLLEANGGTTTPRALGSENLGGEKIDARPPEPFSTITFYPDGSSDSAEIVLASRSPEDEHRISVRLVGITGSISHRSLTTDESEEDMDSQPQHQEETTNVAPVK
jgi:type II secretory pathway pseudopilin PulG